MNIINKARSRRDFLKISALAGGWLSVQVCLPANQLSALATPVPTDFSPNLFVTIGRNNEIIFQVTKQEMGQGSSTGLAMIFADEMGADWNKVRIQYADYNPKFNYLIQGVTGGSSSIERCWQPLREAAAITRQLLIRAAAEIWKTSPDTCYAENSLVFHRITQQTLSFGELIEKAASLNIPDKAPLKDPKDFKYIGKPIGNLRAQSIVSGQATFGIDISLPDMVYAAIERSPVFLGKIKSYNDSEARKVPGVLDVIKVEQIQGRVEVGFSSEDDTTSYPFTVQEGLAVIANSTWAAFQGKKKLQIQWEEGKFKDFSDHSMQEKIAAATDTIGTIQFGEGAVEENLQHARQIVEASYTVTFQAHGLMEPLNATAHATGNKCELWVGHQYGKRVAVEVAKLLQIPVENVRVHILASGGGSGRRWEADFPLEAAYISSKINKPVKVTWTREDDFCHDYYHAYQQDTHTIGLDSHKNIIAWRLKRYTFDHFSGWFWNPYGHAVANRSMQVVQLESPLQTGSWRSVDSHRETFARECLIDELAHTLEKDPLAYRLELLNKPLIAPAHHPDKTSWWKSAEDDRYKTRQVLEVAAQKSGWKGKKGMGIAVTGYCAQVAEIEIVNGKLVVKKITAAVHCGTVVNPSLVKGQVEGSIIWALQALLYGGVHIKEGKVQQSNFHDYKMIRINEAPDIEVHFIESSEPPKGTGEPSVPPLAPAVLNAVFALTGKRIRTIPIPSTFL